MSTHDRQLAPRVTQDWTGSPGTDIAAIVDDFVAGPGALGVVVTTGALVVLASGLATTSVNAAGSPERYIVNVADGVLRLRCSATNQAEEITLFNRDALTLDVAKGIVEELRFRVPTGYEPDTADDVLAIGLASARGALTTVDLDTLAESAWARLQASMALLLESDDGTTDNALKVATSVDAPTGVTLLADVWYRLKIEIIATTPSAPTTTTYTVGYWLARDSGIDAKDSTDLVTSYRKLIGDVGASHTDFVLKHAVTGLFQPYVEVVKAANVGRNGVEIDWIYAAPLANRNFA